MADDDTTETLADVVEAAAGRPLDSLTVTEALDVADRLRALAARTADVPPDRRLGALLVEAAQIVERRAGIT